MSDLHDLSGHFGEDSRDRSTSLRLRSLDLSAESVVALVDERLDLPGVRDEDDILTGARGSRPDHTQGSAAAQMASVIDGSDGTRTRDLRRDRPAF
jgi:hypothetical protein